MSEKATPPVVSERIPTKVRSKIRKQVLILAMIGLGMFGFAYANAEFFVLLCQKAGLLSRGPTQGAITEVKGGRPLEVFFSANVNDNLPIDFTVEQSVKKMRLGEKAMVNYRFTNLSNETIYFRPTHDVSPLAAQRDGVLVLERCFCFDEQKIEPKASYTMPVLFTFTDKLDPATGTVFMRYFLWRSSKERYDAFYASKGKEAPKP